MAAVAPSERATGTPPDPALLSRPAWLFSWPPWLRPHPGLAPLDGASGSAITADS
jgi:hypothetical protein